MAQSFSDYSVGSESDSSKEETIYDTIRATTEKPSGVKMEELQGNTLVIRVVIQDLQQTVSEQVLPHLLVCLCLAALTVAVGGSAPPWVYRLVLQTQCSWVAL